jgi:hypothetical protein
MHQQHSRRRATPTRAAVGIILVLALACVGLAACGGSSKGSTTTTSASASAAAATTPGATSGASGPSGPTGRFGAGASRFKALRECLQKTGITLPKRTPGQRHSGGPGGFLGGSGGPQLPAGVTRAQYEAAIKKCGGGTFPGRRGRSNNPVFKQAIAKFAACMRENGIEVPEPNTSGNGPVFNTKGIDTSSPQFKAAESKCSADLRSSFQAHPGYAPGGPPPSGSSAG